MFAPITSVQKNPYFKAFNESTNPTKVGMYVILIKLPLTMMLPNPHDKSAVVTSH